LVAALESRGWSIWWDPAITPGQEFDRPIATELARASAVLVVWTADSVQSRWVRGEARDGADRGILVPVRYDEAVLPIDFRAFHTIDLVDDAEAGRSNGFQEVVRTIDGLLTPSHDDRSPTKAACAAASKGPERPGVCVLPFANLGGDPEQEYFSYASVHNSSTRKPATRSGARSSIARRPRFLTSRTKSCAGLSVPSLAACR
jgi:adenylate cyclase